MSGPVLVYHGTPRLYPEVSGEGPIATGLGIGAIEGIPAIVTPSDGDVGIAAIRFPKPVRLKSLRIIPGGVVHPTGVGETDTTAFTAEVFLNVHPSDPVNALMRTTARVWPAPHALDFAIDMPLETSTRLVVIRAPARHITMSLYAYDEDGKEDVQGVEDVKLSLPTKLPLPSAVDLIAAIPSLSTASEEMRRRGLATLSTLARATPLLEEVLKSNCVSVLAYMGGEAVHSVLGLEEDGSIDASSALIALTRLHAPSHATYPSPESPLSVVLRLARAQQNSMHPQAAAALSVVISRLATLLKTGEGKSHIAETLTRTLPGLAVHATARGVHTDIPIPTSQAQIVITALLPLSAEVTVDGRACALAAKRLAQPYLAHLPQDALRRSWESTTVSPLLPSSPFPSSPSPTASALSRALSSPSTSLSLSATPVDLLSVLAPSLLASLSTAPDPPLGIPSALPRTAAAAGTASDYAGKVYSAHEFRRDRDTVSGLGAGLAGVGRKASRHVDDFR